MLDHFNVFNTQKDKLNSKSHAYIKYLVISTAAGLGALLHVLSVASLLEGLPGHVLLDVLTLLPGGGGAFPAGGAGAVLLVHILGDGGGDIAADLVRDIITHLAGCGDILANLEKETRTMQTKGLK